MISRLTRKRVWRLHVFLTFMHEVFSFPCFIVVWSRWVANTREKRLNQRALMLFSDVTTRKRVLILISWLSKHSKLIVPTFTTVLRRQTKRLNFIFTTSLACLQTPHPMKISRIETLSSIFWGRGRLYTGHDFLKIKSETSIQSEVNLRCRCS